MTHSIVLCSLKDFKKDFKMNIFITGGTTGIGLALAELYLKEGHRVGICGRNLSKFPSEIKAKYKQLYCYEVDVTKREELAKAVFEFAGDDRY